MADKKPKGEGTNVTLDFSFDPELMAKIRAAADADDRPVSVWLRRKVAECSMGYPKFFDK
jgi:hypothetical protein